MIPKPKILLRGEVKPFEDVVCVYDGYQMVKYNSELKEFYTQPFVKNMIEEYFIELGDETYDLVFLGEVLIIEVAGYEVISAPIPKTLAQFISNTNQANIKLMWKE